MCNLLRDEFQNYDLDSDEYKGDLEKVMSDPRLKGYYFLCTIDYFGSRTKLDIGDKHPFNMEYTKNICVEKEKAEMYPVCHECGDSYICVNSNGKTVAQVIADIISQWINQKYDSSPNQ